MHIQIVQGRWFKACPETRKDLELYAAWIRTTLDILNQKFRFRQPKVLTVRPAYTRGRGCYGWAGIYGKDLYIAMNIPFLRERPHKKLPVTIEEACHIADYLTTGLWSHKKTFKAMFACCHMPENIEKFEKEVI